MGSLFKKQTPIVPVVHPDEKEHRRFLADGVNRALSGLTNNVAELSLKKNQVSTTISDQSAGPDSYIDLMPSSKNGGVALTTWYIASRMSGSFVISHVSTSTSDCTATYVIFG